MRILFFIILNCLVSISPAFSENGNELQLIFRHYVGDELLVLKSKQYKNELGQPYTVSKFKYYVGNIELTDSTGKVYSIDNYFLINQDDPKTSEIILNAIPPGNYKSISFLIGVDSLHNCTGLQEGDLDPIKGMFWAWNTGYIFLKLEGHSDFSKSEAGVFEYHIGGYKSPANAIRRVTLKLEEMNYLTERTGRKTLSIKTDVAQILKQPISIDFSVLSVVADFNNAEMVADNYIDMFSVIRNSEVK